MALWTVKQDFPGQVVAMIFVWLLMWTVQVVFFRPGEGLESFYHCHLKPPTEILNKHMSIGFTVPFLPLISQSFVGAEQIGLLTTAFALTGVLNSIFVYVIAYYIQCWITKLHLSDVSTLCTLSGYASDSNGPNAADEADAQATCGALPKDALRILEDGTRSTDAAASLSMTASRRIILATRVWIQHHVFLILSILLFLVLGVPLSYLRDNDLFLDTGFLFIMWLTFTSAQARLKQHITSHMQQRHYHPQQAQQRSVGLTALATLLNPVLWTSLFLVCYGFAKSCIRQEPTALVVARFKTNNTISDIIAHHIDLFDISDIATSILNAGIVSWGLKLFEYRHQIVSRGGLTVLITSSIVAIFNIIAWPLLAHRIGVRPAASNLSFAARSVTIALSIPAMGSLGGDASVNAVGVVVNGICFQLAAGFLVGGQGIHSAMGRTDDDAAKHHERQQTELTLAHGDDLATVAAGVTIGINAAAMGTAHLYEQNRKAAPYSALSMTMFGIFTVLFTVSSPMVEWLVASVGGGS
ncbi:hypothetical protein M406DRAFT_244760 [Cryphonectria parasitica EP155]|uniref:LrgB-like protein n=1 Tax=Cryphonectria parasitica (strain ATCC 38755 / EP155) TaxID=660469 RepID=A0A9P4YAG6_CRYP1|nr:uncharacterized protein M406DRAFT_244760 [Cryphonectria parasitica EP155]KAF3769451.1 hypothetical protein M406DRAFT_244760 [Cryphonectria parasitica EP155]